MGTAMTELIDELNLTQIVDREKLIMVKYIIEQCLEKEKEQIIDAFNEGIDEMAFDTSGINYYNRNYNQNK